MQRNMRCSYVWIINHIPPSQANVIMVPCPKYNVVESALVKEDTVIKRLEQGLSSKLRYFDSL